MNHRVDHSLHNTSSFIGVYRYGTEEIECWRLSVGRHTSDCVARTVEGCRVASTVDKCTSGCVSPDSGKRWQGPIYCWMHQWLCSLGSRRCRLDRTVESIGS